MSFPIRKCVICSEEFELRPDKPGFANRCPACTEAEQTERESRPLSVEERHAEAGLNEARRRAMRDLLYRKDS